MIIYWVTRNIDYTRKIRERFGISGHTSVNRETECDIREKDMPLLRECERGDFCKSDLNE